MRVDAIRSYIQDKILRDPQAQIEPDQDLLLTDALDSLGVVQLIEFLETEYGVVIPPEDVTLDNFATLRLIDAYLTTRSGPTSDGL